MTWNYPAIAAGPANSLERREFNFVEQIPPEQHLWAHVSALGVSTQTSLAQLYSGFCRGKSLYRNVPRATAWWHCWRGKTRAQKTELGHEKQEGKQNVISGPRSGNVGREGRCFFFRPGGPPGTHKNAEFSQPVLEWKEVVGDRWGKTSAGSWFF